MRLPIGASIFVVILLGFCLILQIASERQPDERPIIAQLYSEPDVYSGRSVAIYGLVVETPSESTFMLQDVSQRPLKIVGSGKLKVSIGDQLIVVGIFRSDPVAPYLSARSLIPTQVVGGGGCC